MIRHLSLLGLLAFVFVTGCGDSAKPSRDGGNVDAGDDASADGGGGTLESCLSGLEPNPETLGIMVLGFQTPSGSIKLRFAVQPGDRMAVGETFAFDLVRFAVESDGVVQCIADPTKLAYDFGHHNWDEKVTATGAEHTYNVFMKFDFDGNDVVMRWTDSLAVDEGDLAILVNTHCESIPAGNPNYCIGRERVDAP